MKLTRVCAILVAACVLSSPEPASAQGSRELRVHLAQANNDSPYAFVRAKFNPGEVADPWAVRFFDDKGKEVPYFVWDAITWRVARDGRADWGKRFALLNHGPGDAPQVAAARAAKLDWTRKNLPELGARLDAQEQAINKAPDSVCAVLYLLRHRVPAFGKDHLALRIYPEKQVEPKRRQWRAEGRKPPDKAEARVAVTQGALEFRDLPDRLAVFRDGKEVLRHAGFQAGGHADTTHADTTRPFAVETVEGIITTISITSQTKWRQDGVMDWQCRYWLFPEGGFVALEGFSLGEVAGYAGGPQQLSIWSADGGVTQSRAPLWDTPWWLHQAGKGGFVATHLFHATPLTIGFGNNPFAVNVEGQNKDPRAEVKDEKLALTWAHQIKDPAIARLMSPQPLRRPKDPPPKDPPHPVRWLPKVDWLYRQYACGLGEKSEAAEGSLRAVLGAAAGWIDRAVSEEEIASLLVRMMPRIAIRGESSELGLLKVVPAVLKDDQAAIAEALRRAKDPVERTDYYIRLISKHVERGGKPAEGKKKDDPDGTPREGWTGNPCYHAALMPCYVRVLEHFELLPGKQQAYRDAIRRYADFTLDLLGGNPIDYDKMGALFRTEWPSRIVPVTPLLLHANTINPQEKYARAVKVQFDDLMRLVERNPHGYFPVWTWDPKAAPYDTVYNPVSYERGITSLWSEGQLDTVGRDRAARFVAAQARWFVFSGQLLDTLETDNPTAIRATMHGGHTSLRNQIGVYLYDDFAFYRGLVADLVAWSAASCQVPAPSDEYGVGAYRSLELSNAGSSMLRWALGIRPGSTWHETKVRPHAKDGFTLQAWNRKPLAKPSTTVSAEDAGLKAKGAVLRVHLHGPAYRLPSEFEVSWTADRVVLRVSGPAAVRLGYGVLRPEWVGKGRPELLRRGSGGGADSVVNDATWNNNVVEWQATPGVYELRRK
jgi:hypothetical protein